MKNIQFIEDIQSISIWQQGEQTVVGVGFRLLEPPCPGLCTNQASL